MKTELRRVRCVINGKETDVWEGYRLWDAALDADARLWKWCGGEGICATCAVVPVSGAENLSLEGPRRAPGVPDLREWPGRGRRRSRRGR
jgi:ferredoxin